MTQLRPLHDRILVRRVPIETKTQGGLYIPEAHRDGKPNEGTVVAVGSGKLPDGKYVTMDVKKGDRVLFGKYAGTDIKVEGQEVVVVREVDVLAVIE